MSLDILVYEIQICVDKIIVVVATVALEDFVWSTLGLSHKIRVSVPRVFSNFPQSVIIPNTQTTHTILTVRRSSGTNRQITQLKLVRK